MEGRRRVEIFWVVAEGGSSSNRRAILNSLGQIVNPFVSESLFPCPD